MFKTRKSKCLLWINGRSDTLGAVPTDLCPSQIISHLFLGGLLTASSFHALRAFCTSIAAVAILIIGVLEFSSPLITPPETPSAKQTEKQRPNKSVHESEPADGETQAIDTGTADTASVGVYQTVADLRRLHQALRAEEVNQLRKVDPKWEGRDRNVRGCILARYTLSMESYTTASALCEQYYAELP